MLLRSVRDWSTPPIVIARCLLSAGACSRASSAMRVAPACSLRPPCDSSHSLRFPLPAWPGSPVTLASELHPPPATGWTTVAGRPAMESRQWPSKHAYWSSTTSPPSRARCRGRSTLEHYEVAQAVDGREALERLGAAPYEAVILDISMPHVDGLEVCRRLREGGDRTPVLMLTARERGRRPRRRPGRGRRRLPGQAVRAARAAGARARAAAPRGRGGRAGRGRSRSRTCAWTASPTRRGAASAAAAHAHRVPAARDVPAPPAPGAHALGDLRARVGL